ncbi:type II toxin-antitoxin system VapC family toxin [bacterium CPR1]|nr:type II toxin-antitoxin system VapC family toxin [bacterium CPR1]
MKVLVDTHSWLWWLFEPGKLSKTCLRFLSDDATDAFFSAASGWELAIKTQLGKLSLPKPLLEVYRELDAQNVIWLDISRSHCLRLEMLPLHHRDPFDRMLAAQAAEERLPVLSIDPWFEPYGLQRIW